jgi:hypothetical protein
MEPTHVQDRRRLESLAHPSENELIAGDLLKLVSDLHHSVMCDVRDRNHLVINVSHELIKIARKVERLPSAYRGLNVTAGETCQDLTKSQTIPATRMVERSQDVPYETAYPISKK